MSSSFTRIDCQYYCPSSARENSSLVTLNPSGEPGSLVFAGAAAARESISGQVACKLAIEHFVTAVLDFCERRKNERNSGFENSDISTAILEAAFKNANTSVYSFGHRLAAGGRMAAQLLGLVVQGAVVSAGRAGNSSAYLLRGGELFPFFETKQLEQGRAAHERLIGAHSVVSVELASVPIAEGDLIVAFSFCLDAAQEQQLAVLLAELESANRALQGADLERLVGRVADNSAAFALLARIGPAAIYLSDAVSI